MQTIPPSGAQYPIRSGDQAAVVVEVGGGLRAYTVADLPIVDGYGDEALAPAWAGQVLAPWPNRIRDGRYPWHGDVRTRPLRAAPPQRDPRAGPLAAVAGGVGRRVGGGAGPRAAPPPPLPAA